MDKIILIFTHYWFGFAFYKKHLQDTNPQELQAYFKELKVGIILIGIITSLVVLNDIYNLFTHFYQIRGIKDFGYFLLGEIINIFIGFLVVVHFRFSYLHLYIMKLQWQKIQYEKYYK